MMSKRILAGIAGLATLGLAGSAMAQEVTTATTTSTVDVVATASIWADATVLLTLNGTGAENYDTLGSNLTHLNNAAADISVAIALSNALEPLPTDMQYWLFRSMSEATAITHIQANTAPTFASGVFRYSGTAVNTGVATTLFANVPISSNTTTGDLLPVVYAADARASLPPVDSHVTVVTWTIAPTV